MKKAVVVGLATAGMTAFGAIDVAFSNAVGVVEMSNTNGYAIASVPFEAAGLAEPNPGVALSNLVQTANFAAGDYVQLFMSEGDVLYSWMLGEDGTWKPVGGAYTDKDGKEVRYTPQAADVQRVAKGQGVRLHRATATRGDGSALPVYLAGQYRETSGARTMEAGTAKIPKRNLVSLPGTGTFDLNAAIGEGVLAHVGESKPYDEIDLITDGAPVKYTYRNGFWGHEKVTSKTVSTPWGDSTVVSSEWVAEDAVIPRGTGFWYVSRGGTPTVKW